MILKKFKNGSIIRMEVFETRRCRGGLSALSQVWVFVARGVL